MAAGCGKEGVLRCWFAVAATAVVVCGGALRVEAGTTHYTYDAHGRLISVIVPSGADTTTTTYEYDEANNRTSIVVQTEDVSAPVAPSDLAASPLSWQQIALSWSASSDVGSSGLAGYRVYRGGELIASPTTTSYVDEPLAGSTSYTYTVFAIDNAGNESGSSNSASATTPRIPDTLPPGIPENLQGAAVSGVWINLIWSPSEDDAGGMGLAGYEIFRDGVSIGTSTVASYSDQTLSPLTAYTYQVRSYDSADPINWSELSAPMQVTTLDDTAPSAPGVPIFDNITTVSATARWDAASDNVEVTGYRYSLNGGVSWVTVDSALAANLTELASSNTYTMLVQARDAAGNWGPSSSGIFTTFSGIYTDTAVLASGFCANTVGYFYGKQGACGSVTPAGTSNGFVYAVIGEAYEYKFDLSSYAYDDVYMNSRLSITGFSADPGAAWLISFNGMSAIGYGYSNGMATWILPRMGLLAVGPTTLTIVHR
jgi:YD repeat-containing protein